MNTVESLPRLPSESGIIDIQWKRRIGQRNAHLQAKVDPNRIFNALEFLRKCGNKYYMNTQSRDEYENRCQNEDPVGFNVIFGKDTVPETEEEVKSCEKEQQSQQRQPPANSEADGEELGSEAEERKT